MDTAFRSISTWVPMLRFPYLKEGETKEKRDGMRTWMVKNGYTSAPVSIDTSDWYFNSVFLAV
jgi:peptidoglycan-N-acetylglucosamine deacetylase